MPLKTIEKRVHFDPSGFKFGVLLANLAIKIIGSPVSKLALPADIRPFAFQADENPTRREAETFADPACLTSLHKDRVGLSGPSKIVRTLYDHRLLPRMLAAGTGTARLAMA